MIRQDKKGFTIIELLLAMTMVSLLMMAIFGMITQMNKIFVRGNTYRTINTAARTINDDLTRTFNSMPDTIEWDSSGRIGGASVNTRDGALFRVYCFGGVSYVMTLNNTSLAGEPPSIRYSDGSLVRFAKVSDPSASMCVGNPRISNIDINTATDLIGSNDIDIGVYDINIIRRSHDAVSGQSLIEIEYILATRDLFRVLGGAGRVTRRDTCLNSINEANGDYCGIQRFNLIVRTSGR